LIKKLKSSLTVKIFLLTALLLTVCCIATYGFIAWMIPKTYPNQIDWDDVEPLAYEAAQELRNTNFNEYAMRVETLEEIHRSVHGYDIELHIFDANGYEVAKKDLQLRTGKTISDYDTGKRTHEYSFFLDDSTDKYVLLYADSSQAVNQALEALNKTFPYLIITVFVISAFAAFVYSKYITAPILKIDKASQKMTELDFNVKCETDRIDELGRVSKNLNALSGKLSVTLEKLENANAQLVEDINKERQLEKERLEFFSAVSHELKTPITIVKGQLQGMICEIGRYKDRNTYLVQSLDVVNNLEKMVQELLTVSRMDAPGYTCYREQFDLVPLIKQCLTAGEDIFIQKDMKLFCTLPGTAIYEGDQQLLKKVFDNLIINALTYSPTGNSITVNMIHDGDNIKLSIENTGVYIENEDIARLFEAFYRPDQSRNRQTGGSGLGLYIVKKILDLHSAKYHIESGTNGVIFTVIF